MGHQCPDWSEVPRLSVVNKPMNCVVCHSEVKGRYAFWDEDGPLSRRIWSKLINR